MAMMTADADYRAEPPAGAGHGGSAVMSYVGAALSVAIVIGIGVWGAKMVIRDVSGVPVVRASEGPMRIAPETPGGEVALNTGLAVNAVAAVGGAEPPEDRVTLAPATADLAAEDLAVAPAVPEAVTVAVSAAVAEAAAGGGTPAPALATTEDLGAVTTVASGELLTAEEVLALADELAAGAAPLEPLAESEAVPVAMALTPASGGPAILPASVPGVARSLRPALRPASLSVPAAAPQTASGAAPVETAATTGAPASIPVLTQDLPAGTRLVQLGAFDSPEVAEGEWARLTGRFADFFDGKTPVIQQASSGGKTFFRLRAQGFADLSDARRFCAALVAENAPCIPVVVR